MSQDDLDRLINEKRLVNEAFDDSQIAGFLSKAAAAFDDAQMHDISLDTRLQIAYRACLQATLAVLASKGFRVKSNAGHYIAFYAMQRLDDEGLRKIAIQFDDLRTTRAESVYEPNEDEAELDKQLTNALETLKVGLPLIRTWIVRTRPSIERHFLPQK
jgi:hypothetical protein